ncbi:E3 ubiquitin-protein ligase RNF10 [Bemisia tabaci]|uniref:E3 ubiquitin-protein ligase RNF10 n=1 Tax=Bemisia tabaci TaxID=7038 RepID=UPI003B280332
MLEELNMDKNILNRVAQPLAKGSSSDSRKSQDGSKSFPRGSKRREPQGPSTSKFDQNRKPITQKTKSLDKRPRSRGFNNGRKTCSEVADEFDGAEYGSVVKRESKKHNLNHLLNFHYAPRPGEQWGGFGNSSRQQHYGHMTTRDLMATHKHKYNKEQFLQANCQFVVRADGEYSVYLADPDALVDWEFVEQIRMPITGEVNCPICLFHPVAAKMTRCGHIFCWSCILHYLALSDKTWRKCPICYEAVHKGDLKSVVAVPRSFCAVGEPVTLKLMKREKGVMQCVPVSQFDAYDFGKPLSVSEGLLDTIYAKLLVAGNDEVLNIVETEEKQLLNQLKEDEGCPEICFVEQALNAVRERKAAVLKVLGRNTETVVIAEEKNVEENEMDDNQSNSARKTQTIDYWNSDTEADVNENIKDSANESEPVDIPGTEELENRTRYESTSSEGGEENANSFKDSFRPEDLEFHATPVINNQNSKYYYFYQASDGQQVYLHALNTRMLEMHYGSLENCPERITGRVLEKESGSMTEELRKRLRYLQHLPVTCQFDVVEIELGELVSSAVMESFRDQIDGRERRRCKRAKEERRRERKIEADEKKMYGQFVEPRRRIRLDSYQHFPECGLNEAFPAPPGSDTSLGGTSDSFSSLAAGMASASLDESGDPSSLSFAQMLRDGKKFSCCHQSY